MKDVSRDMADAIPTDDELVSQFGVRLFFDEKGDILPIIMTE